MTGKIKSIHNNNLLKTTKTSRTFNSKNPLPLNLGWQTGFGT
jgi:hypothetical protein